MQLRNKTAILLSFLILFSNLGLAFNVHYCHNKIASVSFKYQIDEPCQSFENASTSCCAKKTESHKECCSNKVVKSDKKSDNTIVDTFQLNLQAFLISQSFESSYEFIQEQITKSEKLEFYCDSNAPPFYKLFCQLIFYA